MDQMDHLSALASLQSRFTTELADAAPSAPVPSYGSWTVAELADHPAHETLIHLWDLHTALALMLWGRADQDSVTVTGEASVVETFLTEALTP